MSITHEPLFSIITVTYNAAATIYRTLESIAEQSYDDYEHLIIDGKSTDHTLDIVNKGQCAHLRRVTSEPDRGIYDAMNRGIGMARGRYLIFLNAGDKFHSSNTLAKLAEAVKCNEFPDIVYGQTDLVDDSGRFIAKRHLTAPANLTLDDFKKGMMVCHQAFIVRRDIAPYYNLKYRFSADYEWCLICIMHSQRNVYIDDVLIDYLIEGMTTANHRKSLSERFKIMCIYYGFWPTLFRHIGFLGRHLKHKKTLKSTM